MQDPDRSRRICCTQIMARTDGLGRCYNYCGTMRRKILWRCQLHGGLSTGPTSLEGRERIATAARHRWAI